MFNENNQEIEEKLTPQEKLRARIKEEFYSGKIVPSDFNLKCPLGHQKTTFQHDKVWFCNTCQKYFLNKDSSYWKNQDIGVSNLHKEELNRVVIGHPDVRIVIEYVKIYTSDERQINRIIGIRIKNGVQFGANESAELATQQLKEMLPNAEFKDGFSRGNDILMIVDNGTGNENE